MLKKLITSFSMLLISIKLFAGLTVTPARQEVVVPPAAIVSGTYTVKNDFDVPVKVEVEYRDWYNLPENKDININNWLKISPKEFKLRPRETKEVYFHINSPALAVGTMVAMISFVPHTKTESGVTLKLSSALYVTIAGTEKVDWIFDNEKISKNLGKLQVFVNISNKGNIHLRPSGYIEIFSDNKSFMKFNFIEGRPIYPQNQRTITAVSDAEQLKSGKYTALINIKCGVDEKTKKINFKVNDSGEVIIE